MKTCPTVSGSSILTYEIEGKPLKIRITHNSGSGFFSKEWVAFSDIQEAISIGKPFTSVVLHPLFNGKSINTPGFMLAVLLHEGLVKRQKRHYVALDAEAFMARVKALAEPKAKTKSVKTNSSL